MAPPPAQAGSLHECQSVPFCSLLNTVAPAGGVGRPLLLPVPSEPLLLLPLPLSLVPLLPLLVVLLLVVLVVLVELVVPLVVVLVLLFVVLLLLLLPVELLLVVVVGMEKLLAGFTPLPPHPASDKQSPMIIQGKICFMINRFSLDFWMEGESYAFT